jgi:hypothetical protein
LIWSGSSISLKSQIMRLAWDFELMEDPFQINLHSRE